MDIEKLRTFLMVSQLSSFSEAAELLYITPATASKHVSAIEDELGVKMFERTSKQLILTKDGQRCAYSAERIVEEYDSMAASFYGTSILPLLSIPFLHPSIKYITGFMNQYPNVTVELQEKHGLAVVKAVKNGIAELGIAGNAYADDAYFEKIFIFRADVGVILPCNHPFADRKILSIKELKKERFYLFSAETGLRQLVLDMCMENGFTPMIAGHSTREDILIAHVAKGGAAFFSRPELEPFNSDGVVFIPLKEKYAGGLVLIRLREKKISKPAELFWNYLAQNIDVC